VIQALVLLLFVSLIFGLLLFFFLGTFSRLMADDFCYFANASEMGAWNGLVNIYTTWSGRYATIALSMLFEPLNRFLAQAAPGLILLAWLLSLIGLLVSIVQKMVGDFPRSLAWVSAAAILFLTCLVAPNRFQVLYWLNGTITYTVPLVALTALLYWSLQMTWREKEPSPLLLGLFSLAVLFSGGFSETTAALQFSVFVLLLILFAVLKVSRRALVIFGLAAGFSLVAMLIFLVSPGNQVRQALFPQPPGLPNIIWLSFRYTLAFIYHTLIAYPIPFLFSALVAVMMGSLLARSLDPVALPKIPGSKKLWIATGITALVTLLLVASTCAPSVYAQSAYPEPRALFPATYILVFGVFAGIFLAGFTIMLPGKEKPRVWKRSYDTVIIIGLILACIYPLRVGNSLNPDLLQARAFASAWDERDRVVQTYRVSGKPLLELKAINSQHGISELDTDPEFWVNKCFARYYGLENVSAK
jgi:hypothetical protein